MTRQLKEKESVEGGGGGGVVLQLLVSKTMALSSWHVVSSL